AYQGARSLGVDFVGSRAAIAQAALNYVARDATVTDEQVREYYEANVAAFTVGPEAVVTQVELASQEAAAAFRAEVLGGADVAAAAAEHGGEVVEHGRVLPGTLEADIDTALFGTDAFEPIAGSAAEVSDVLVIARPVEEEDDAADAAGDEGWRGGAGGGGRGASGRGGRGGGGRRGGRGRGAGGAARARARRAAGGGARAGGGPARGPGGPPGGRGEGRGGGPRRRRRRV